MRKIVILLLLTCPFIQAQVPPPTVRTALALAGDYKTLSLRDDIVVVVCKGDYDAWLKDQKEAPALSLYLNDILMKGLASVRPQPVPPTDELIKGTEEDKKKVKEGCVNAAQERAKQAATAAETARQTADRETDPEKKKTADKSAKDARDKADAASKAAEEAVNQPTNAANPLPLYMVVRYYLDPKFVADQNTKEPWLRLLDIKQSSNEVKVSVGLADGTQWPSSVVMPFERIHWLWFAGWIALFAATIIVFILYARRSDIIRDSGQLPWWASGTKKAYSLARFQMAVWTFTIAFALAFLFMVTWNANTISSGVLVLMGISLGTTLMSAVADQVAPTDTDITSAGKDAEAKAAAAKEAGAKAIPVAIQTAADLADKALAKAQAAADKAATDKAAADKVLAEAQDAAAKATGTDKVAVDKAVADAKAAADNTATDKEAADKALADAKAEADKAVAALAADKVLANAQDAAGKATTEADKNAANKALAAAKDFAAKDLAARYAEDKVAQLKAGISQLPQPTKGFLTDLLTDGTGTSFHRFQMLLFTVVLWVIFVVQTAGALVMPEFDATLLGLMGISSGTYLGFKLQGK